MEQKTPSTAVAIKQFFEGPAVQNKFKELLGKKAQGFITSVLQVVASNDQLQKADPVTVYQSAAMAATLDLPINQNLGFAYVLPYKVKQKDGSYKDVAQFQMGYKGFIQLAQRSGQFRTLSASPIFEGQLVESNPLTGYKFDFTKKTSDKVIGYAAYFALVNGFEKTLYMTYDELQRHGTRFSQTFKKGYGLWKDDFDSMAQKTVIKLLLSKFAPLSIEMQKAVISDQGVIQDGEVVQYADNEEVFVDAELVSEQKEQERITKFISEAKTKEQLEEVEPFISDGTRDLFNQKLKEVA
jgi:recombination protein RecT